MTSRRAAAGHLVQPFDIALPNDYSYWLAYPRAAAEKPDVAAFRAWLLAEAGDGKKPVTSAR